jgi:hypothetical protein
LAHAPAEAYRQYARLASDNGHAIVCFDGLILDAWTV